jgi:hypothetical protein
MGESICSTESAPVPHDAEEGEFEDKLAEVLTKALAEKAKKMASRIAGASDNKSHRSAGNQDTAVKNMETMSKEAGLRNEKSGGYDERVAD